MADKRFYAADMHTALNENRNKLGADAAIITKTVEAANLGESISLLFSSDLPIACQTYGQSIPEEICAASSQQLINDAVKIARHQPINKEQMIAGFSAVLANTDTRIGVKVINCKQEIGSGMNKGKPIQVIAVTGGKGGVAKANLSVNLSLALSELGKRVVLKDADLGLANVDLLLGVKANKNIADVLTGDCELQDIQLNATGGIKVIPASSGTQELASMGPQEHAGLINAFSSLDDEMDVLVIDTAAGISDTAISFVRASQEIILVVCDEPSSITDAYALIKILNRDYDAQRFRVVANMTRPDKDGQNMFNKLVHVADRFLDVSLQFAGEIPFDDSVRRAVKKQKATLEAFPVSKSSMAYKKLARTVSEWPVRDHPQGHLGFFVERLVSSPMGMQ